MADDKLNLTESFKEITVTRGDSTETIKIPMIGQGTWMLDDTNTEKAVSDALSAGYVAIDTAQGYGNEEYVGRAIQRALAGGLARDKIFISSKLNPGTAKSDAELGSMTEADAERERTRIRTEVEKSFAALGLTGEHDYIDCYYIHSPAPWNEMEEGHESEYMNSVLLQWQVLNEYYQAGKIKTIGVSNFSIQALNRLKEICELEHLQMPQVMQMPLLIGHNEEERVRFCTENNIQPVAYSILGSKHLLDHELVKAMASKYGMTPAELCTYYTTQVLKVPSLTRSTNPERIRANSQVPNVPLSELDTRILSACNDDCREWDVRMGWHHNSEGRFLDTPFGQEQIDATRDGVGGLNVLDLLPFADLDYDTLETANPEIYARYNETAQRFADTFGTLDLSTLNEVITHLTPSKALLLDNCRHDFRDERTNLTGWLQSALITKLVEENSPIPTETARKIYELGWRDSFLHDLEIWRADERFASNPVITSLITTFESDTPPILEEHSEDHTRRPTPPSRSSRRSRVPDKDLKTVLSHLDEKTEDFYLYVPYTKNNGTELDYLEIIVADDGLFVNVAGFKEDPKETTRCKILTQGLRDVDGEQHLAFGIEQNHENSVVILPITVSNNEIFFRNFQKIANYTLEDTKEIKDDKIPEFTTITKDLPELVRDDSAGGSGGSGERRREPRTETRTETIGPRRIPGNLIYKAGDISYIFLPYKTADNKDSHLVLIQQGENLYLNIKGFDETDRNKSTTCQIFSASFVTVEDKEILSLELEVNGRKRSVNFPIPKERNEQLLTDLNALLAHTNIRHTEIEVYDCPRVSNPAFDESLNPEMPLTGELSEEDKLVRAKRTGQALESQTLTIGEESITGFSQEIEAKKLGLSSAQKITLFDSTSYTSSGATILKDALLMVTSEDKSAPVAIFTKGTKTEEGREIPTIQFKVSKEFIDDFRAKNPEVEIPDGSADGDYVVYEVDKLKLSQDLNISDVQIRGAGSEFAVLFSALGCQIVDKNKHFGMVKNEENPFNIGVTTDFLSTVLKPETEKSDIEKACSYDRTGVSYEALLISRIQLERKKSTEPDKIVSVTLPEGSSSPEEKLYSVPIKVKNEDGSTSPEYLNIRIDREGKSYAYLHITGESVKSAKIPKFYEIDIAHLEESASSTLDSIENPSLYLGLKDGKDVVRINIDINYDENSEILRSLKTDILKKEFNERIEEEEKTRPLFDGAERKVGDENYLIYPRPKERKATVLSYGDIAILTRKPREREEEHLISRSPTLMDPPVVDRERTTTIIDRGGGGGGNPPSPPPPEDPEPEEPIKPIDWKEKLDPIKPPKKNGVRNMLIGLFALCTLMSILVPWLAIGSIVFAGAAIVNEVRPWIVSVHKANKERRYKKQHTYKPGKDKEKELQQGLTKTKGDLVKQRNKLNYLNEQRRRIEADPTLSESQRRKKLEKIDKEINSARVEVERLQIDVSNQELNIQSAKLEKQIALSKEVIESRKKRDEQIQKAEDADLSALQKTNENKEKELNAATTKMSELTEEKEEFERDKAELDALEARDEGSLSPEELEKLKKLRAKMKKKKGKTVEGYEREIAEYGSRIETLTREKEEAQGILDGRSREVDEQRSARDEEIRRLENEEQDLQRRKDEFDRNVDEANERRKHATGSDAIMEDYSLGELPSEEEHETEGEELSEEERRRRSERGRGREAGGAGRGREAGG